MGLFAIIPLDDDAVQKIKNALSDMDGIASYNLDEVDDELMKRYNFVSFEGTPASLSNAVLAKTGEPPPDHLVFDMSLVNIGGFGPSAFIQWINQHGK